MIGSNFSGACCTILKPRLHTVELKIGPRTPQDCACRTAVFACALYSSLKRGVDEKRVGNAMAKEGTHFETPAPFEMGVSLPPSFFAALRVPPRPPLLLLEGKSASTPPPLPPMDESSLIPLYVGHQSKRAQDDVEGATKRREREREREADRRTEGKGGTESLSSLAEDDGFGLAPLGLLVECGPGQRGREFVFAPAKRGEEGDLS